MSQIAERAYSAAPVWMQHLFVSAYGAQLRRRRYGGEHHSVHEAIRQAPWLPKADQESRQLNRLNALLQSARASVPFYADRIPSQRMFSLALMDAIPLLRKHDVLSAGRDMLSRESYRQTLLTVNTGGTTGTPLAVTCTQPALRRNYAFFSRFLESAGLPARARVATFAGRVLLPPSAEGPPYWRYNLPGNALLCSSYHIGPQTVAHYADALARFQPLVIDAYPSSIAPIARHLLRSKDTRIRPRAVITSSETLSPEDAASISAAFNCPVFDHYGSAEMVALITQCREGVYHVNSDYGVVELLDGRRPVGVGEEGDIIATGFINPVMPFIRYVTGDRAIRGPDTPCACGSSFPRIERILGRADDVLITPEGHHVGRLDPIFKSMSSLDETRIVQDEPDHVRVEIVSSHPLSQSETAILHEGLRNRLGPTMRIDFVRVAEIKRTAGGKLRSVVNLTAARSGNHPSTPTAAPANPD